MTERNDQTKNNRLIFMSIVGIPITIVLAATWLWFFVVRGDLDLVAIVGTSNHGTLVQPPRALGDDKLYDAGGAVFTRADPVAQWTFLVPGGARCGVGCEDVLYLTRQIHQAMGQELTRIRRVYVSATAVEDTGFEVAVLSDNRPLPANFQQYLAQEQRGLQSFRVLEDGHATLFPEYSSNPTTWYLVDPEGWIMMSYNSDVSYKDIMADLKFLLKNSSE